MKKALIAIAIAFVAIGAASAQPWSGQNQPMMGGQGQNGNNGPGRGYGYSTQATAPSLEKTTIEGKLELVSGRIAIKKDAKTYFVMIPNQLYGFIPGLVEGATVKVEGYSYAIPNLKDSYGMKVTTLTLGGKTIDLASTGALGSGQASCMMGGGRMGGGMGGKGRW